MDKITKNKRDLEAYFVKLTKFTKFTIEYPRNKKSFLDEIKSIFKVDFKGLSFGEINKR